GKLVQPATNCRICGLDTSAGPAWADANGYLYCQNCLTDLRGQAPYQSPLFKCCECGHAWPLKGLIERGEELVCKDCTAAPQSPSSPIKNKKQPRPNARPSPAPNASKSTPAEKQAQFN